MIEPGTYDCHALWTKIEPNGNLTTTYRIKGTKDGIFRIRVILTVNLVKELCPWCGETYYYSPETGRCQICHEHPDDFEEK